MKNYKKVPVVYEDEQIIVCEKPAGMPVQSDHTRDIDMQTYLKGHIFEKQETDQEPYLTAVHRLDRPVGGLMVFARTREAAAELSRQIQNDEFEKYHQAVVCGSPDSDSGVFEDYLLKDGKTNTTKVVSKDTKGAKQAVLEYELIDQIESGEGILSWMLIILRTGRHHQIRVQFAERNMPLYGDTKYNPRYRKQKGKYIQLGLYSTRLAFTHPFTGERMVFKTEPRGEAFEMMDVEAY
jgi:23S rRNA pseudouridine1911/1915/1917 synthase